LRVWRVLIYPSCVLNAVLRMSSCFILIWWYLERRSNLVKKIAP
jgi:hypothetical protein